MLNLFIYIENFVSQNTDQLTCRQLVKLHMLSLQLQVKVSTLGRILLCYRQGQYDFNKTADFLLHFLFRAKRKRENAAVHHVLKIRRIGEHDWTVSNHEFSMPYAKVRCCVTESLYTINFLQV